MANEQQDPQDPEDPKDMEHRLDEIEEEIQKARHDAEEDRVIPGKHEPTFIDPNGK
jgi:hypothetical protein